MVQIDPLVVRYCFVRVAAAVDVFNDVKRVDDVGLWEVAFYPPNVVVEPLAVMYSNTSNIKLFEQRAQQRHVCPTFLYWRCEWQHERVVAEVFGDPRLVSVAVGDDYWQESGFFGESYGFYGPAFGAARL